MSDESPLAESLFLLLRRADEILERPDWFFCEPPEAYISVMFFGGGHIPLGVLLGLWRAGHLTVACPACRGPLLVYGLGGSPLSGRHAYSGVCRDCGQKHYKGARDAPFDGQDFNDFRFPLVEAMEARPNRAEIEPGERPRFSWKHGLAGARTPDRVVRPAVEPVPFAPLIDILRGGPGAVTVRDAEDRPCFRVDWQTRTLRAIDRSPDATPDIASSPDRDNPGTGAKAFLFTQEGRHLRNSAGAIPYDWDSRNLRGPDGRVLHELTRKPWGAIPKRDRTPTIRAIAPLAIGPTPKYHTWVQEWDGDPVARLDDNAILDRAGETLYRFDHPIPTAFAVLLATGLARRP